MSDGDAAIFNGAHSVWQDIVRLTCYPHVKMKVLGRINTVEDEELRAEIICDIHTIQLCSSREMFLDAIECFRAHYTDISPGCTQFIECFIEQWVETVPC